MFASPLPDSVLPFHAIAITGASSGLGAALALRAAGPGRTLFLAGRNDERLEKIAEQARSAGAQAHAQRVDVTDGQALKTWITACEAQAPLDLVIANAGISGGTGGAGDAQSNQTPALPDTEATRPQNPPEPPEQIAKILAVNLHGAIDTVLAALPAMQTRGRGQIGVVASLAGYRGWAGAPAYCGSKAGIQVWAEGMRGALRPSGVGLSVINPGFVRTPMTDANGFSMPFMVEPERAAEIILRGLARNRGRISFPWQMAWIAGLTRLLPQSLIDRIQDRLPRKGQAQE
ncbi:MAG: SDR family NAD(P)-dependent oxidoreductase [Rhodospirillaceae bacterium]